MDAIRSVPVLFALAIAAAQPALAAEIQIYTDGVPGLSCSESNATGALLSTSCSNGGATASASGVADYRHVGVAASTSAEHIFAPASSQRSTVANAHASAYAFDYLTVSSQGKTGTAMLSFSFVVSRSLQISLNATEITTFLALSQGAGGADLRATLRIAGQEIHHLQQDSGVVRLATGQPEQRESSSAAAINNVAVGSALGSFRYSVPIVIGQEFLLSMALRADVSSSGSGTAGGDTRLNSMNSFDWGGIQGVTVDGQPAEFSVTSQSGTDWTQAYTPPVPELPTLALLLGGLGVVLRRATRAKARHASRRPE